MRNVGADTITGAVISVCGPQTDPRVRFLLEQLITHIHDFARETKLTHEEWRKAISLLTAAGDITDEQRNEFVLFSDVLGLSSLVDLLASPVGATQSSVLGPFHILGAPLLEYGGDLKKGLAGNTTFLSGRILSPSGAPIPGAEIEMWQTGDNGLYSNQDAATYEPFDLRARMIADNQGRYAVATVMPKPYTVPDDGPAGELLRATGRHPWRAAHFHFIVRAPGRRTLVTELFPSSDPYLDADAVFGVREGLIVQFQECRSESDAPGDYRLKHVPTTPFYKGAFDFTLAPE